MKSTIQQVFLLVFLIPLFLGCKKYERDNPNDIYNEGAGTPVLKFSKYTVTEDTGNDKQIQRGDKASVEVYLKNEGSKYTTLKKASVTSSNPLISSLKFELAKNPVCYVGKENAIGSLSFLVSDEAKSGDVIPFSITFTDQSGLTDSTSGQIIINEVAKGVFAISSVAVFGRLDPEYSEGLAPYVAIEFTNTTYQQYRGPVTFIIRSKDPAYPYYFKRYESYFFADAGAYATNLSMDCFGAALHNNQNLAFSLEMIDKDGGSSFGDFSLFMASNKALLTLTNPVLYSPFSPNNFFGIYMDINNAASSRYQSYESVKVTCNSPYVSNLNSEIEAGGIDKGETQAQGLQFQGFLHDAPEGATIVFNVTVTTDAGCGAKKQFTSQVSAIVTN